MKLSERQQHMLVFIQDYYQEHLYPPTIREIGEAVGISSTSVVNYNLNKLVDAGMIQRNKDVSRGIRLTSVPRIVPLRGIPILGHIAAGQPITVFPEGRETATRLIWPPTCSAGPKRSTRYAFRRLDDRRPGR